ncbi:MAG: protein-tyrosine phosphatase family protein [Actinomycetales bacterium]
MHRSLTRNEAGALELPDGRHIRGTALHRARGAVGPPDFAVYLLGRPPGDQPWEFRWVKWRDFGRPSSTADAVDALREAFERSSRERVEIACDGGIGRTGTALALMAMMAGTPSVDAVAWVRKNYHPRAVETPGQRRWLDETAARL